MSGAQRTEFQQHFPALTDQEAANALTSPGEIVSLTAVVPSSGMCILKLASRQGSAGTFVLNGYVAKVLKETLQKYGF